MENKNLNRICLSSTISGILSFCNWLHCIYIITVSWLIWCIVCNKHCSFLLEGSINRELNRTGLLACIKLMLSYLCGHVYNKLIFMSLTKWLNVTFGLQYQLYLTRMLERVSENRLRLYLYILYILAYYT